MVGAHVVTDRQGWDGGDGWPHRAQQSEESQTDGLVKETSPHEGTGLYHRVGEPETSSFLPGAAPGWVPLARAWALPSLCLQRPPGAGRLSLGSVSGMATAEIKNSSEALATAGEPRSPGS